MQKDAPIKRDLLARAYLDMLAADAGANNAPLLRVGKSDDPVELLVDELAAGNTSRERTSIRADLAAVAVVVARTIEAVPGLTVALRRSSPVLTIASHSAESVSLVATVIETCAFGTSSSRSHLLMAKDGTANDHKPEKGNDKISDSLHAGLAIVGIAPDPKRHLPRDLMRTAEHHLTLGQLDDSAISLVIEAVTGMRPTVVVAEKVLRAADISDLVLAIRADRNADDCVARLEQLVATKGFFDHRGPTLEELSGYGLAREWGLNLVEDLRDYKAGIIDWESIEKGLLLVGPPGVGKTQYARALAKSANVPLVATSVADWNACAYLSGTLSAIKTTFEQARKLAPCVMFVDELDGISDRATLTSEYREYWTQIVNLLLEQLAGVEDRPGVVVIGATNHVDHIDPAIRRAGRLDRTIEIGLPDLDTLAKIFRYHLGDDLLHEVDLMPAAMAAVGKTGADVEAWVRRAKGCARRKGSHFSLDLLLREIRSGRDVLSKNLRRVVAVHESGHLVAGVSLNVFLPQALSVLDAGGATRITLSRDKTQTEAGIEDYITALLSGRAAEEVVLGQSTAGAGVGAHSDLALATEAAIDLELRLGFGVTGLAHFSERTTELLVQDPDIIGLIKRRLDRCHSRAIELITRNRGTVDAVARRLEDRGYLDRNSIDELLSEHPAVTHATMSS